MNRTLKSMGIKRTYIIKHSALVSCYQYTDSKGKVWFYKTKEIAIKQALKDK